MKALIGMHGLRLVSVRILAAIACFAVNVQAQVSAPSSAAGVAAPASKPAAQAPPQIKVGGVTVFGSLRLRVEDWDWFDTTAADGNYTFGAALLRLGVGQQRERFDWQVEGAFPLLIDLPDNAIAPAPQGQLGLGANYFAANREQDASAFLKQAFVRLKGIGGDKPSTLRLGRFEFIDGSEVTPADPTLAALKRDRIAHRLIGPFTFSHVQRSFDGVQYSRTTGLANFTVVAARPTEGVFQLRGMKELDVDFYYGAVTKPFKTTNSDSELRAFVLHYHDGRGALKSDNRTAAARVADSENIRLTTVGGHYINAFKAGDGKVDLLLWGSGQVGQWGALDHHAAAVAAEAGFQPGSKAGDTLNRIKPWIRAGYFRSTGDGNAGDREHTTFFQVLPTPRVYARFPFYNLMNNEDVFGELMFKPHTRLSVRADFHNLRLSNQNDLWYQGGGAFQKGTFGYVARPAGGSKQLGKLVDFSIDCNVTSRSAFTFYIAGVRGGRVEGQIYPLGKNARFAYAEFTQRF